MVINASSGNFYLPSPRICCMAGGMWTLLMVPAVLALIFGAWVMYSIMVDVSAREASPFTVIGPDTIRMQIKPSS